MQVNKHVWRGFYDLDRLKWDVLYNAGAGCEILARMMQYASAAEPKFDPVPVANHSRGRPTPATTAARARAIDGAGASLQRSSKSMPATWKNTAQ